MHLKPCGSLIPKQSLSLSTCMFPMSHETMILTSTLTFPFIILHMYCNEWTHKNEHYVNGILYIWNDFSVSICFLKLALLNYLAMFVEIQLASYVWIYVLTFYFFLLMKNIYCKLFTSALFKNHFGYSRYFYHFYRNCKTS